MKVMVVVKARLRARWISDGAIEGLSGLAKQAAILNQSRLMDISLRISLQRPLILGLGVLRDWLSAALISSIHRLSSVRVSADRRRDKTEDVAAVLYGKCAKKMSVGLVTCQPQQCDGD